MPRWWPVAAVIGAGVAFVAHDRLLGFTDYYGLFGNGVDALVYRHGGLTARTSDPLYSFFLFETLPFTYPPFAALMFVPLSLLSVAGTAIAVNLVNLVLLYLAVRLSWRALGYEDSVRMRVVSVASAVALTWIEPVRMTLWLGQINLVLLVLVLWDLSRPEQSRLRGIGVGLAAGLKLTPAFFIAYLVVVRQWRAAMVATLTFAATIAAGFVMIFTDAWQFWTSAIIRSDRIGLISSPANQSVRGILARALRTEEPPMWLWLLCAGVVAVAGLWAAQLAHRHGRHLLSLTVCGLTAPMVSPFSWGHHWVWVVPLLVLCLDQAVRWGRWWGYLLPVAAAVPLCAWYRSYPDGVVAIGIFMTPGEPLVRTLVQSAYPIVFAVLVAVVLVAYGRRTPTRAAVPDAQQVPDADRRPTMVMAPVVITPSVVDDEMTTGGTVRDESKDSLAPRV
ncbi:glycosyltransferase 87 family protein [Rhodococcus coprophilus]|uniref:Glycosyltransferase n=1 Tax=Rhodococcus coprophilus TaxID=38310 RepID=A0A2X4WX10_9NOCA|nr:glycosyltransferase 87 family protein [Rhodococcus coprophilus]MBM7460829.1 alpha-1,2-mannosyltransferase [Rhodococcus coprophilus]SQI28634.1 glycosyltransferase [Rhodococcus coprophilus]